jgi:hypothetical protein
MASRPSGTDGPENGPAFVTIEAANAVIFDKQTGALIESEQSTAEGKVT